MKKKFRSFALNHDYIKIFTITYVVLSVVIAITLGLFYFFLWIVFHFLLELYKRNHLFRGLKKDDILIALQHCRIDLMFLFVGIGIEALAHHAIAVAPGRSVALLEVERSIGGIGREIKIIEFLKTLPRIFGMMKTAKSTVKIVEELLEHRKTTEKMKFKIEKIDIAVIIISFGFLAGTIVFQIYNGVPLKEIIKSIITVLSP